MEYLDFNESWIVGNHLVYAPRKTKQTGKVLRLAINKAARFLLDELILLKKNEGMKSEQKINKDLKAISARFGIEKNLTMHVGRHTFATTFLEIKGSLVYLKEVMGHSKVETTMVYSHAVDTTKDRMMMEFDNHFDLD